MVKTLAELALMQTATDVTIAAYRWLYPRIEKGMRQQDVSALMSAATKKLGGSPEFSMCLIGESAAYPHGPKQPQKVDARRNVLMACGWTVNRSEDTSEIQSIMSTTYAVLSLKKKNK